MMNGRNFGTGISILLLISLFANISFAQKKDTVKADTAKLNIADTLKKDLFTAPDTVSKLHTNPKSLIPPIALVGYGASTFFIHPLRRLDSYVYSEAAKNNFVTDQHFENYFQYGPVLLTYGLNLVGVHGKNTFLDRTLIYGLAQVMLEASVLGLKLTTHRLRPNGADYYSFPSGHTANAFSGAEFMAQELGGKSVAYSYVGYSLAITTGVFRIYHQDHWFSDVIAGAGFGILATKGAYLLYPYLRNAVTKKEQPANKNIPAELMKQKQRKSALLLPSYNQGALGLQFAMQL